MWLPHDSISSKAITFKTREKAQPLSLHHHAKCRGRSLPLYKGSWMNFPHTRQEQTVPSGGRSSSEAEACPSWAVTKPQCHEHQDSGTDSQDKKVQKGSPSHKGLAVLSQHFLRLVSWYHSRARNPCSSRYSSKAKYFLTWGWKHPHCWIWIMHLTHHQAMYT